MDNKLDNTINNWNHLITKVSLCKEPIFDKLLTKINQFLKIHFKNNENFNTDVVEKNHMDTFNMFNIIYEQLLVEDDITDIFVDIPSLESNKISLSFTLAGVGKWIKIHSGNASRLYFFDEDKTVLSDKSLADFLNKIDIVKKGYRFFGNEPVVYYKFKTPPSDDIKQYLENKGIEYLLFDEKTKVVDIPKNFEDKLLLDQSIIITLCSNLSFGLSDSYYDTNNDDKNQILSNKRELDVLIMDKMLLVSEDIYNQTKFKINLMGGPEEKNRFNQLSNKMIIVPEIKNQRFHYLKDLELPFVSVAEKERALIVTTNQRLVNKLSMYYKEMPYKLFYGVQLSETKYT